MYKRMNLISITRVKAHNYSNIIVSDIAIFVLKRDVKLQLTDYSNIIAIHKLLNAQQSQMTENQLPVTAPKPTVNTTP